jgi:hypothetical protein
MAANILTILQLVGAIAAVGEQGVKAVQLLQKLHASGSTVLQPEHLEQLKAEAPAVHAVLMQPITGDAQSVMQHVMGAA